MGQEGVGLAVISRRPPLKQLRFQLRRRRCWRALAGAKSLRRR
jgi:hypothetical protein